MYRCYMVDHLNCKIYTYDECSIFWNTKQENILSYLGETCRLMAVKSVTARTCRLLEIKRGRDYLHPGSCCEGNRQASWSSVWRLGYRCLWVWGQHLQPGWRNSPCVLWESWRRVWYERCSSNPLGTSLGRLYKKKQLSFTSNPGLQRHRKLVSDESLPMIPSKLLQRSSSYVHRLPPSWYDSLGVHLLWDELFSFLWDM